MLLELRMSIFDVFGIYVLLTVMYLTPSILAVHVGHPHMPLIVCLNVLLGWTVVGWLIALGWSATLPPLAHSNCRR